MREAYEAWFKEKFGFPAMPIHSRVVDFCWEGYQAGVESLRKQLADRDAEGKLLRDASQKLVDRWDSPLWKDHPHTANYIHALRKALDATNP